MKTQFYWSATLSWPWSKAEIKATFRAHQGKFEEHFKNGTFGSHPEGRNVMALQSFCFMPFLAFFLEAWNAVIVSGSFWYLFIGLPLATCAGMLMYERIRAADRGEVPTARQQIELAGSILLPALGWWIILDLLHMLAGYLNTTWLG